jgi:LPS O-antigen subunit length determinant protein (WzzB/FepE family)
MSNPQQENDNQEEVTEWEATQIIGDCRKFLNYVLVPNHKTGKDKIFIGTLGFRPNSNEDAQELLSTYISQAQAKFSQKDYVIGEEDQYGQRFTIVIEVRGKRLLTGWILDADGTLKLVTPFSGFAR